MTEATSTWEISVYHYDMFHQQQNSQVRYLLTIPSRYIRHVLSEVTPEELEIHFFVVQWSMWGITNTLPFPAKQKIIAAALKEIGITIVKVQ